jgi:hypothetical protein
MKQAIKQKPLFIILLFLLAANGVLVLQNAETGNASDTCGLSGQHCTLQPTEKTMLLPGVMLLKTFNLTK